MVKNVCTVCGELMKKGIITLEGKKFCCKECCEKFKEAKKKGVCEFC